MTRLSNQLHEDGRRRFESLGRSLLNQVMTFRNRPVGERALFSPNRFTSATITEEDIVGDLEVSWHDGEGRPTGVAVAEKGGLHTGLLGPAYGKLESLAVSMARVQPFQSTASVEFLRTQIFEWIKERHRRHSSVGCVDYVLRALERETAEHRMLFPVSDLHVQSELTFGSVTVSTFPEGMIEELESRELDPASNAARTELCRSLRRDFQGASVAETCVFGEPIRAREIGRNRVEEVVGVLRFFAPGHLESGVTSRVSLWGCTPQRTDRVLFSDASKHFLSMSSTIVDSPRTLTIDDSLRDILLEAGLSEVRDIISRDKRTDLEQALLTGIVTFGRAVLTSDNRERIIWYCAGLESMLLRNSSEPILQNLGDRLALFSYDTFDERKKAVKDIKNAYSLRSRFVHQGAEIGEGAIVTQFARHGLHFFSRVARSVSHFGTKKKLLDHIDDEKFSGSAR